MKGFWIVYSAEELAWIKAHAKDERRATLEAFVTQFNRPDVTLINLNSLCKRKGWLTGRTGRFNSGAIPFNKGKKMAFNENCARTQFKKGGRPHNTKYLGHERIGKDGYIEISIDQTNPHTGFERRHVQKHKYLWEQKNGPVPSGMCLKCLDGKKTNTATENWEAIPRALLPTLVGGRARKNPYDEAPLELKPAILLIAKTKHKIRVAQQKSSKR